MSERGDIYAVDFQREKMNRVINSETADSRWNSLYKISGIAALIAGVLFLVAVIGLIIIGPLPGRNTSWLVLFHDNWLAVIFKLHAGFK